MFSDEIDISLSTLDLISKSPTLPVINLKLPKSSTRLTLASIRFYVWSFAIFINSDLIPNFISFSFILDKFVFVLINKLLNSIE